MSNKFVNEIPGLVITGARYVLAEKMAHRIEEGEPIGIHMGAFIAWDVLDGAFLRQFDADTPLRRVADGVVDHLSMLRVGKAVMDSFPETDVYVKGLGVRAAIVGVLNAAHYYKTGEVTKGRAKQRATNLATAAFGLTAARGGHQHTRNAGLVANIIAFATAPAHLQALGQHSEEGIRKL